MKSVLIGCAAVMMAMSTVACSGGPEIDDAEGTTSEDALRARVTAGVFKLYGEPNHEPTPGCDIHTRLELAQTASGSVARLENTLGGACAVAIDPDSRSFRLRESSGTCGTKIFSGSKRVGNKRRAIKITDYRAATCADSASQIVVEETLANGQEETLYSYDEPQTTPADLWLTFKPRQCRSNPWDSAPGRRVSDSTLSGEAGTVDEFFRARNIELTEIGFLSTPQPVVVCAACQCPRGDRLVVKAKNAGDVDQLESFGFEKVSAKTVGLAPESCNTNPWDDANREGNARDLGQWAESLGADISHAGFVKPTESRIVCQACGCPRGYSRSSSPRPRRRRPSSRAKASARSTDRASSSACLPSASFRTTSPKRRDRSPPRESWR